MDREHSKPHSSSTINSDNTSKRVFSHQPNSRPDLNEHLASRMEEESRLGAGRAMGILVGLILALQSSHIRITDKEDELIWEKAQLGKYSPKIGYQQLCSQFFHENKKWWQKGI